MGQPETHASNCFPDHSHQALERACWPAIAFFPERSDWDTDKGLWGQTGQTEAGRKCSEWSFFQEMKNQKDSSPKNESWSVDEDRWSVNTFIYLWKKSMEERKSYTFEMTCMQYNF